jgi:uncharacterized membrane protein
MGGLGITGLAVVGLVVLVGAGTQRLTGLGFALVSAPFLVLLLGPFTGVLLANALSLATNLVVLAQTWRAVQVRRALLLAVPALIAVVLGAWVEPRRVAASPASSPPARPATWSPAWRSPARSRRWGRRQ